MRSFAELFTLCGFAITQPLLDLFGRAPEQFAFRGAHNDDIIRFGLIVTVIPALVLWAGEAVVGLISSRIRRMVHIGAIGILVAALAIQLLRSAAPGPVVVVLAVVVGSLGAFAYVRTKAVEVWLAFASAAPPVFLALFLLVSDTAGLLRSSEAAAIESGVGNPAPVVVLVLDELPLASLVDSEGRIDAELYPNLAELAGSSHWFRNTTGVSTSTWHAVPAIATGNLPRDGTAPVAADHPESLFTLLGSAYDLRVTESITRMCPSNLCEPPPTQGGLRRLLHDATDVMRARLSVSGEESNPVAAMVEGEEGSESGSPSEAGGGNGMDDFKLNQPERFTALLDGIGETAPTLHYLHVLLPHQPWRYLPSGARYRAGEPDIANADDVWADQPWLVDVARQRHIMQAMYVDRLVGQLVDHMRQRDVYDDALLVVTADHGISFDPRQPMRGLNDNPIDDGIASDLMWVPLLVKVPGQEQGEVSDRDVRTIDVLPTIADVLEIDLPWKVDGRSVFGRARSPGPKVTYQNLANGFGVDVGEPYEIGIDAGWKLVLDRSVEQFLPAVDDPLRIWRLGPDSDLVGTRVDDAADRLELVDVEWARPNDFTDVDPSTGIVPALVQGSVKGLSAGEPVAVAVNGEIVATAPTFDDGGRTKVAAMTDGAAYDKGDNEVTLYRIRD